jgi:hypothetical protein
VLAATLAVAPLGAQSLKGRGQDGVPDGHRPPPGMCRIWIDGVPPGQQPAPTDCATAVRNRPANGRVIFGDDPSKNSKVKPRKFSASEVPTAEETRRPGGVWGRVLRSADDARRGEDDQPKERVRRQRAKRGP